MPRSSEEQATEGQRRFEAYEQKQGLDQDKIREMEKNLNMTKDDFIHLYSGYGDISQPAKEDTVNNSQVEGWLKDVQSGKFHGENKSAKYIDGEVDRHHVSPEQATKYLDEHKNDPDVQEFKKEYPNATKEQQQGFVAAEEALNDMKKARNGKDPTLEEKLEAFKHAGVPLKIGDQSRGGATLQGPAGIGTDPFPGEDSSHF